MVPFVARAVLRADVFGLDKRPGQRLSWGGFSGQTEDAFGDDVALDLIGPPVNRYGRAEQRHFLVQPITGRVGTDEHPIGAHKLKRKVPCESRHAAEGQLARRRLWSGR